MSEADRQALAHTTTHVADGLARLTDRWRGKPAIEALLSPFLAELQEVEDQLWSMLVATIDTATGVQLDQLAALIGEPRLTLDDGALRTVLRARVLANRSSGSVPELVAILVLFAEDSFTLDEVFPAGVLVTVASYLGAIPAERVGGLLHRATAGGVGAQLVAPASSATAFRFASTDDDVEAAVETGFSDTAQTSGGHLAGVY